MVGVLRLAALAAAAFAAAGRTSSEVLPPCTFEECVQCLPLTPRSLSDLTILGTDGRFHSAPLRIGRAVEHWDTQSIHAQLVGILVAEKLGIRVEYVSCIDETSCFFAVNNCIGWSDYKCDQPEAASEATADAAAEAFPHPLSDVMFVPEIFYDSMAAHNFEGTQLDYDQRPGISLGPAGFTSTESAYVFPEAVASAWSSDGLDLLWFRSYQSPQARAHLEVPQRLMADGIGPEVSGCSSELPLMQTGMTQHQELGWTCNSSWWLTPACAALGDQWPTGCIGMLDDDWRYPKPQLYRAIVRSGAPFAKLSVGYELLWELISSKVYNVTFIWWSPDASLQEHSPRRISWLPELEPYPKVKLKAAWGPAVQASTALKQLLENVYLETETMVDFMTKVADALTAGQRTGEEHGPAFYQKIACDWLRENEGLWSLWLPSARACPQGQVFHEPSQQCSPCPAGSHFSRYRNGTQSCQPCMAGAHAHIPGLLDCVPCAAGSYQERTGQSTCKDCDAGSSQPAMGQSACTACEVGRATMNAASSECNSCGPGTFAASGATSCPACLTGSYADTFGASACTPCGRDLITSGRGSIGDQECVCPEGSYRALGDGGEAGQPECAPCLEGMRCPAGSDMQVPGSMQLQRGFMSRTWEPYKVFKCAKEELCPGGAPGTCAPLRDVGSVACAECPAGFHELGSQCHPCGREDLVPALCAALLAIGMLCALAVAVRGDFHRQTHFQIDMVAILGLAFTCIQTFAIFRDIQIGWPSPISTILDLFSLLSFNLRVLRIKCVVGESPLSTFTLRQCIPILSVPVLLAALLVKRLLRPGTQVRVELANAVGTIFSVFFISIIMSCDAPLVCYQHPPGSGASVAVSPSVLCFEGGAHTWMVVIGVASFLTVPLPCLALSIYLVLCYPHHASSPSERSGQWLRQFRFFFFRFRAKRYFYGIVLLARSLLLCVVPAVFSNVGVQVCLICGLLSAFTMAQAQLAPWRSRWVNILDGLLSNLLMLVLLCGSIASDVQIEREALVALETTALCILPILFVVWLLVSASLHFRVHPAYDLFLCHHKAHAQAQARLLKIRLRALTRKSVFMDSDNLLGLDGLFDIIKCQVRALLVLLTRETLTRVWCAGEIATAHKRGLKIVAVRSPSFVDPTESQMQSLDLYVDMTGCSLGEYSITLQDVRQGFEHLLSQSASCVTMRSDLHGVARFEDMLQELLRHVNYPRPSLTGRISITGMTSFTTPTHWQADMLAISSEPLSDEACAAASVVISKLKQQDILSIVQGGIATLANWEDADLVHGIVVSARAVVVLLSPDTLTSQQQLQVIVTLMQVLEQPGGERAGAVPGVIPVSLPGFEFPAAEYYDTLLPRVWPGCEAAVSRSLRAFFCAIAVPLSSGASEALLAAQVRQIAARVPRVARKGAAGQPAHLARPTSMPAGTPRELPSLHAAVRGEGHAERSELN